MEDFEEARIVFQRGKRGVVAGWKAGQLHIASVIGFFEQGDGLVLVSETGMKDGESEGRNIALIAKAREIGELLLKTEASSGVKARALVDRLNGVSVFGVALKEKDGGPFGNGVGLTTGMGIEALESKVSKDGSRVELERLL